VSSEKTSAKKTKHAHFTAIFKADYNNWYCISFLFNLKIETLRIVCIFKQVDELTEFDLTNCKVTDLSLSFNSI